MSGGVRGTGWGATIRLSLVLIKPPTVFQAWLFVERVAAGLWMRTFRVPHELTGVGPTATFFVCADASVIRTSAAAFMAGSAPHYGCNCPATEAGPQALSR
jgi:hypothetical protein